MILDESSLNNGSFLDANYYVQNPVAYTKDTQLNHAKVSIALGRIGPKTIVNPHGLLYIRGGNHKALHIANFRDYLRSGYDKIKRFEPINVFHYPIRSYTQFEKNIINRKNLLKHKKKINMGPHYRRWVTLYDKGKLQEEFHNNIVFAKHEINILEKYAIIQKDDTIKNKILHAL